MFKVGDRVVIKPVDGFGVTRASAGSRGVITDIKAGSAAYVGVEGKERYIDVAYMSSVNGASKGYNFFDCELELEKNGVEIMVELL